MDRVVAGQFGICRHGVSTSRRSPETRSSRHRIVPIHLGFQAASTLVHHWLPSIRSIPLRVEVSTKSGAVQVRGIQAHDRGY